MARPKKSDGVKRTQKFEVRVTPDEKTRIKEIAREAGNTPSDLLRLSAIRAEVKRNLPTPEREILLRLNGELGKIGSNLNQIARAINRREQTGEDIGVPPEVIIAALQEHRELSQLVLKVLKNGH